MEANQDYPRVTNVERFGDGVVIEFDDGQCALFSAAVLHAALPQAVRIEASESESDSDASDGHHHI
jgi:predicted NAD/FAD-binding protein